jgi:hypothetical protein
MSVTIELDLPEALLQQARQMGLLDTARMAELLTEEVRRRSAGQKLKKALEDIRAVPGDPMTEEDIAAEVKASRAEKRLRETRP